MTQIKGKSGKNTDAKLIRDLLPHGAIKSIAEKTRTSPATVNRVIDGKSNREDVIKEIRKVISQQKVKKNRVEKIRAQILA